MPCVFFLVKRALIFRLSCVKLFVIITTLDRIFDPDSLFWCLICVSEIGFASSLPKNNTQMLTGSRHTFRGLVEYTTQTQPSAKGGPTCLISVSIDCRS